MKTTGEWIGRVQEIWALFVVQSQSFAILLQPRS